MGRGRRFAWPVVVVCVAVLGGLVVPVVGAAAVGGGGGRVDPLLVSGGTTRYLYGPGGLPVAEITDGTVRYLHTDQAGSVRTVTGPTGTVTATSTWDAYGARLASTGTQSRLGWYGQYTDADTGLVYLRARYYDPVTATFLTLDHLTDQTATPYTYADADPWNQTDPSGLCPVCAVMIGGAASAVAGDIALQSFTNLLTNCNLTHGITLKRELTAGGIGALASLAGYSVERAITRTRTGLATEAAGDWDLPVGGAGKSIGGRWYSEHALERMAPNTPEVMAALEGRALARALSAGLSPGTPEFGAWWAKNGPAPRNVPPMVVEAEIAVPGSTSVRVITNANGDVVTVIPR